MDPASSLLRRRALLACAGLLAALNCLPSTAADLLASIRARGSLRVAMEGSYPPFNFPDAKTGMMTGYDADVARLLGTRLGLKIDVVNTEWGEMFSKLEADKVDVIVNQVIITPKRQQTMDFSEPYTYSGSQLALRKNDENSYASLLDLKGKTVGVTRASYFEQQVRAVAGVKLRSYPAVPEILQDLAFGRIDASLNDSLMLSWLISNAALPLKPGPMVGEMNRIGVAIQKGNPELKAAIDQALSQAQADGSLGKLARKWFRTDVSRPVPPSLAPTVQRASAVSVQTGAAPPPRQ